jgi:hypothetical protein
VSTLAGVQHLAHLIVSKKETKTHITTLFLKRQTLEHQKSIN